MILQSKDEFDQLARVNDNTGEISFVSRHGSPGLASLPIHGSYAFVDGKMCSLYRKEGKLYLSIERQEFDVSLDTESLFIKDNFYHIFKLNKGGKQVISFRYKAPILEVPLELDPTPFVEYEDFDFLYFVHSVLKDGGRRQRIYNDEDIN